MADAPMLGRIVWHELVTSDMKKAEDFYTKVVGWTVTPFEGAGQPYDVLQAPGGNPGGAGGVMKIPEGMNWPPHWVMYVGVPKLEDAVANIQRLGGKPLSEVIEVPKVGRLRVMLDPQGGMFAIMQPTMDGNAPAENEPAIGEASWHELYADDAAAAMKFYSSVFGWKETEPYDMGPMGKYYMFARAFPLGGMMSKTAEMKGMPTSWGVYFRVPDVDAGAEKVKALGGQVLNGPMEVPGGDRVVNCMDPQGAAFSLHQKK
jgi:uncharacterized protein